MNKQKKEPSVLAGTEGSDTDRLDNQSTTIHSTRKKLKNQESFQDFTEEDPKEPAHPENVKGKFWCFVLYPDSAPANWEEQLNLSGIPWSISPIHKGDMNADGGNKKPHYHVILIWQNSTTYNTVKQFTQGTLHGTVPQVLRSVVGYYRYFTHADNPEKCQYDEKEIRYGNGFDIADYMKLTKEQKLEMHAMLTNLIRDNGIWDYLELCTIAQEIGFDEYECVVTHTLHFKAACKSAAYRLSKQGIQLK